MMNARARTLRSFRMDNIKVFRLNYHKVLDFSSGLSSQLQYSTIHIQFFEPPSELVQFSVSHFHLSFTSSIGSALPFQLCDILGLRFHFSCTPPSYVGTSRSVSYRFFRIVSPFSILVQHFQFTPPFQMGTSMFTLIFLLNNLLSVSQHLSNFTPKYSALHLLSRLTPPFHSQASI